MHSDDHALGRFRERRDPAAFHELYRRHTPALFCLALRLAGGTWDEAEDLVQEAWIRAIERLSRFAGRSSFRTWLCGILINCHRERRRQQARDPDQLDAAAEARIPAKVTILPSGTAKADPMDVERAIARLPDGYREVLVLHDLEGYTHQEIAGLLGIRAGTSKSQLARGRARLRELLRAGFGDGRTDARKRERQ